MAEIASAVSNMCSTISFLDAPPGTARYNKAADILTSSVWRCLSWSRSRSIDYMMAHYLQTREQAAIEVDRYITWPGQACAYKVGEMKILQLRNKTEAALGKQSGDSGR